jgi:catechol 2,3-dioxygenase-like lactoylglutathione lyase family enzyme
MAIEIETLHHVSLSVTDLERARTFYSGVLGLREIERPAFDFPGAWFALGDRQLHLIVHPTPRSLRGTTEVDPRDGHFALRVKSHGEALACLRAHGVEVRDNPRNATLWEQIHFTDPDGNVIELNAERKEGA